MATAMSRSALRSFRNAGRATQIRLSSSAPGPTARYGLPVSVALAVVAGSGIWYTTSRRAQLDTESNDVMFSLQMNDAPGSTDGSASKKYISMSEVAQHSLFQDCWVVVDGKVYDVTDFHKHHPGGAGVIVANAGTDVTHLFNPVHPPNTLENNLAPENFKGLIDPVEAEKSRAAYEAEQQRIADGRAALPEVEKILSLDEIQAAAESFLPPKVVDYYGAASLDGYSLKRNRDSFQACRLVPRVMNNVRAILTRTKLFGLDSPLPIYVSPASNALLGHPDGELNIVRGAAKTGIIQGVSAAASYSLTEILDEKDTMDEETGRKMGMVYQVYVQEDREKTTSRVKEAVAAGCQALLLTVDSNVLDLRQSTSKINGTKGDASPGVRWGPHTEAPTFHDCELNWGDLDYLKDLAQGTPIYLKGISSIEDIRLAKKHGLAGCILSNHGGRQLDGARTGFESLRAIHAEDPQLLKDVEVYLDGGVRRGTDVLKAVALGARGVGLGRPFLWAQAAYGEQGVIRAVRILEAEIIMAMRLLGINRLEQMTPDKIECLQEVWK